MSNRYYELGALGVAPIDRATTRLLYVSASKYSGDWNSFPHTHGCAEIFYVVGGTGQFMIESLILPVSADDMVVVNPGVKHTETSLNASPLEYIVMGVEGLSFVAAEDADDRYCIINCTPERGHMLHALRTMLAEIENREPGYGFVCQDLLEVLIVRLLRNRSFPLTPASIHSNANTECATIRRYIDGHFKENITLDILAELSHVSKYHMARSFSRQFGISPINYLIQRRIEESKHLLKDTDLSMSRIAHILAFSSPSYFSQSFRRLMDMSPMEFRKLVRSKDTDSLIQNHGSHPIIPV